LQKTKKIARTTTAATVTRPRGTKRRKHGFQVPANVRVADFSYVLIAIRISVLKIVNSEGTRRTRQKPRLRGQ
jgi:hypothetical protein